MICVKIIKCDKNWWYEPLVGQTIEIEELKEINEGVIRVDFRFLNLYQRVLVHDFELDYKSYGGMDYADIQIFQTELEVLLNSLDEEVKNNIHS